MLFCRLNIRFNIKFKEIKHFEFYPFYPLSNYNDFSTRWVSEIIDVKLYRIERKVERKQIGVERKKLRQNKMQE